MLKSPHDGIDRAGRNTEGAANTTVFVNLRNLQWAFFTACNVKRDNCRAR
jgi:hypothetical protein